MKEKVKLCRIGESLLLGLELEKFIEYYTALQGSVTQTAHDSCRFFDAETESDIRIAPSHQDSE